MTNSEGKNDEGYSKFYKVLAVSFQLYGSESQASRKRGFRLIESSEMRFLRLVKRFTRLDSIRSIDIRQELGVQPTTEIHPGIKEDGGTTFCICP